MENDLYVNPTKTTFAEFMEFWLDEVIKNQVEQTTHEGYKHRG